MKETLTSPSQIFSWTSWIHSVCKDLKIRTTWRNVYLLICSDKRERFVPLTNVHGVLFMWRWMPGRREMRKQHTSHHTPRRSFQCSREHKAGQDRHSVNEQIINTLGVCGGKVESFLVGASILLGQNRTSIYWVLTKCQQCAMSLYMLSCNPHNNPVYYRLTDPCYDLENWGSEKLRSLSEITQLVNGGVGMLSQFYLMCLLFTPYCFKVLILGTDNNYRQLPSFQSGDDRDGRGFSLL